MLYRSVFFSLFNTWMVSCLKIFLLFFSPINYFEIIWIAQMSVRCKRTAYLNKLYFVHSRYTFRYTYCVTTYLLLVRRVTGDMCIFHCNLQYIFLSYTYLQIRLLNGFHHYSVFNYFNCSSSPLNHKLYCDLNFLS
jgi:hypothetical protein